MTIRSNPNIDALEVAALDSVTDSLSGRSAWQKAYVRRLTISDAVVVFTALVAAELARFGPQSLHFDATTGVSSYYGSVSLALGALWLGFLSVARSRSPRVIGSGPEEYRRVVSATVQFFGTVAMAALVLQVDLARGYLAVALPVGLLGLVLSRREWRRYAIRLRRRGQLQTTVLVVGGHDSVLALATSFELDVTSGYSVVGMCMPGHDGELGDSIRVLGRDIPIFGDEHGVVEALSFCHADTVAVTATEQLGHHGLRKLTWDLDPFDVNLVVSPGVIDVSGPRLVMRPVAGLPLIHVEKPQYNGAKRFSKTFFDIAFASAALLLVAPILLVAAIAIKLDTRGSIFYRSERIGLDGTPFGMIKLRSMVADADVRRTELAGQNESAGGVLFKMRDDPRITRVGKVLRRTSIDELPQFLNVLLRDMSVVGPRPPLRSEVETYNGEVRRRLLVKPGVTGLWQVSGRSDLSWDEAVRLDLSYVENWSMVGDILIVAKTVNAVLKSDGAY